MHEWQSIRRLGSSCRQRRKGGCIPLPGAGARGPQLRLWLAPPPACHVNPSSCYQQPTAGVGARRAGRLQPEVPYQQMQASLDANVGCHCDTNAWRSDGPQSWVQCFEQPVPFVS